MPTMITRAAVLALAATALAYAGCVTRWTMYRSDSYEIRLRVITEDGRAPAAGPPSIAIRDDAGQPLEVVGPAVEARAAAVYGGGCVKSHRLLNLVELSSEERPRYPKWFEIDVRAFGYRPLHVRVPAEEFSQGDEFGEGPVWNGTLCLSVPEGQ